MGDVVGQVRFDGMVLGAPLHASKDIEVGAAVQAGGTTQLFASRDEALAAIERMPPSEADFAVMQRPDGRFEIRAIVQDYAPGEAAAARLQSTPPATRPSAAGEPVAVVFRGRSGEGAGRVFRSQVITAEGAGAIRAPQPAQAVAVPVTDPAVAALLAHLSAQDQARLQALSPADQRTFTTLVMTTRDAAARRALLQLLASGRAGQRDTDGQSVLDQLRRLQTEPLALPTGADEQRYRDRLLAELSRQIALPGATIHQGTYDTCGATCCQIEFASHRPADYARFIVGLASTGGEATLPDGSTLRRVTDSLDPRPGDRRSDVSRLAQAAIMNVVTHGYSNQTDRHSAHLPVVGTVSAGQGAPQEDVSAFLATLRGGQVGVLQRPGFVFDFARGLNGDNLQGAEAGTILQAVGDDLAAQRQAGTNPPMVPCGLVWADGNLGHEVVVTAAGDDRIFFRNPHGDRWGDVAQDAAGRPRPVQVDAQGREYIEAPYPDGGPSPVRFYRDGSQSMGRQDFVDRLQGACLTRTISDRYRARELQRAGETMRGILG